ncbi:hypothetical protein DYB28_005469, partial [Aphanomyces astaci]
MRRLLATHETHRLRESKVATLLQKIWRGRVGRATVKHMLKERLRTRLRYLSPTGSLHRLRDVAMYRGDMRRTLERMLTLVEDVHVSFRRNPSSDKQDQQDMPDDLHMSSKAVSIPAWAAALEQTRIARLMELDRQYDERLAIEAEDRWVYRGNIDRLLLLRYGNYTMAEEESRTRVYVDAMAKATFLHQCKLRKRQVELDHKAEAKARMAMEREELDEITRLRKIANKIAYNQTLKRMQAADEAYRAKQAEKLFEARCRKLMHNEEMRLHRLYTEVLHRERLRERKERHLMHNDDMYMQRILDEREKLRLRTMEKTHRVEMAVEDVRSHQWRSLEAQATSMGLVRLFGIKQFGFLTVSEPSLPPKPKLAPTRYTLETCPKVTNQPHPPCVTSVVRVALRWLRMAFRDGYKGPTLLRNIAKCYVKLYEAHLHDNDLSTGWSWYVKACEHLALQASPSFLDEMARALYLLCRFQHAA